jgi:hypothetical protein
MEREDTHIDEQGRPLIISYSLWIYGGIFAALFGALAMMLFIF